MFTPNYVFGTAMQEFKIKLLFFLKIIYFRYGKGESKHEDNIAFSS